MRGQWLGDKESWNKGTFILLTYIFSDKFPSFREGNIKKSGDFLTKKLTCQQNGQANQQYDQNLESMVEKKQNISRPLHILL